MAVDWVERRLTLDLRVMMTEHQDMDQRARVTMTGLVLCSIDPPEIDPARGYEPCPSTGLWINTGSGAPNEAAKAGLPATPEGCFLHWFFVHGWNSFIHVCARDAELSWIEAAPVPARAATRALFPGDEIPDPSTETRELISG
jgi:hypothetical protein